MEKLLHTQDILLICAPDTESKVIKIKEELTSLLPLDVQTYTMPYDKFADTARNTEIKDTPLNESEGDLHVAVQGKQVRVYADCFTDDPSADLNSKYMFYQHIIEIAKDNRAESVNIIYPCFPYWRSDKNDGTWSKNSTKKVPTMAKKVMRDASDGFTKNLITLDIHNPAIFGMWNDNNLKKVNLEYRWMMEYAMRDLDRTNVEIGSTDLWWSNKISNSAADQWLNNYVALKDRDKTISNTVKEVMIFPSFAQITWKDIIIYDDIIDTWGTICKVVDKIIKYKPKSIRIVAPNWMFNNDAYDKLKPYIEQNIVTEIIVSDSVTRSKTLEWVTVLPSYKLFSNAIASLLKGEQVNRNWAWGVEFLSSEITWT